MKSKPLPCRAFTLVEMLVVIGIIVILAGLLFPTFGAVKNSALKTQAANEEQQIVTATKAYFTDYGKYPVGAAQASANPPSDTVYGDPGGTYSNERLINVLRGLPTDDSGIYTVGSTDYKLNPRQQVYLEVKDAKDKTTPKGGISVATDSTKGQWMDPWGKQYIIWIDADYDNQIGSFFNVYNEDANNVRPRVGVAVASMGKDLVPGKATSTDNTKGDGKYVGSDDVVSWR